MKATLLVLLTFIATPALSSTLSTFQCELAAAPGEKFTFNLSGVGTDDADIVLLDPEDDYSGAVTTESTNIELESLVATLNGQGSPELREQEDRFEFFGDSAGIDLVWLNLFKNSGYTKGYVRTEYSGEGGYSLVSCTITTEEVAETEAP